MLFWSLAPLPKHEVATTQKVAGPRMAERVAESAPVPAPVMAEQEPLGHEYDLVAEEDEMA